MAPISWTACGENSDWTTSSATPSGTGASTRPWNERSWPWWPSGALAPDSKLAGARWAGDRAWIPGLDQGGEELEVQHFYRAMDFLAGAMDELREHLYFQVTGLLNADVSVLFYDTTSVSFEIPAPDEQEGLMRLGNSKKNRGDLPQVVLGLAINRDGLPVRHWVFPGNTVDVTTVEGVVNDLLGLLPRRFLFVGDRDMWRAERAFRSMKSVLRMEPVYHRADRRIVSHAHLCVLADLLMRIAENRVEESWPLIREKIERVSVGRIETDHAAIFRVKRLKDSERQIWNSCGLEPPPKTL